MMLTFNKRKYGFLAIGLLVFIVLIVGVFNALMFGKEVFQGAFGEQGSMRGATVQFDFQRMKGIEGISGQ